MSDIMACGHSATEVWTSRGGTSHCVACEREGREERNLERIDELVDALFDYGDHSRKCRADMGGPCTCGLSEMREKAAEWRRK